MKDASGKALAYQREKQGQSARNITTIIGEQDAHIAFLLVKLPIWRLARFVVLYMLSRWNSEDSVAWAARCNLHMIWVHVCLEQAMLIWGGLFEQNSFSLSTAGSFVLCHGKQVCFLLREDSVCRGNFCTVPVTVTLKFVALWANEPEPNVSDLLKSVRVQICFQTFWNLALLLFLAFVDRYCSV